MQSEWDQIQFELNMVIGKLIKLSESDNEFDALLASSYRDEVTLTRDSIVATLGYNSSDDFPAPTGLPSAICDHCGLPVKLSVQGYYAHFYGSTFYYTIHPDSYSNGDIVTVNGKMSA